MDTVTWMGREIPILIEAGCCVAGGGTAGAAAAISALRMGIDTVVVEKNSFLGGSQTGGLVMPMMHIGVDGYETRINCLIQNRLVEEGLDVDDKFGNKGWFDGEKLKYVLEQLIVERGGKISYLTDIVDVITEGKKISCIIVNTIEGLRSIKAETYIDCTGDALLGRLCGISLESGYKDTGKNQHMTLRFEMGGINLKKFVDYVHSIRDNYSPLTLPFFEAAMIPGEGFALESIFRKGVEKGQLREEDIKYIQFLTIPGRSDAMTFNCPEIPDSTCTIDSKKVSSAIIKGREMINRLGRFFKANMPGFEKSFVSQSAPMIGIRESNRIKGIYYLDIDDFNRRARFEDGLVKVGYPVDVFGVDLNDKVIPMKKGEYFEIPYRSLIVSDVINMVTAGRCISASFIVQSSARIQPVCRALGEAAGIACALSIKEGTALNRLDGKEIKKIMEYEG